MFKPPHEWSYKLAVAERSSQRPWAAIPFELPLASEETIFEGFGFPGDRANPGEFRTGWRVLFSRPVQLRAMLGATFWVEPPAAAGEGIVLRMFQSAFFLAGSAFYHLRPAWLPVPNEIVYENVDEQELRKDLIQLPKLFSEVEPATRSYFKTFLTLLDRAQEAEEIDQLRWEQLIDMFLEEGRTPALLQETPSQPSLIFPLLAGWPLGRPSQSTMATGKYEVRIRFESGETFLNPSWYVSLYKQIFAGLDDDTWSERMADTSSGLITNGVFRFVRKGGLGGAGFTTVATASSTVQAAVQAAELNDTIVILDDAEYREPEIVIDKPLTLMGFSHDRVLGDDFNEAKTTLPRLSGGNSHRVILVKKGLSSEEGVVCLKNLIFRDGRVVDRAGPDDYRGGGGVAVERVDRTLIENCAFIENRTIWVMGSAIDLFSRFRSEVQTGIKTFKPELEQRLKSVKNFGLVGQAFGGGVNCLSASAFVLRNRFERNEAMGRGGAIGAAGYGWPIIEGNYLRDNRTTHGQGEGRPDGGGIGITVAVPSKLVLSLSISDLADDLIEWQKDAPLTDFLPADQIVRRFFRSGTPGSEKWRSYWDEEEVRHAKVTAFACLVDNHILDNHADDDGGGVYFSVLTNAYMLRNIIHGNKTLTGAGGGLRSTMGSATILVGGEMTDNHAFISSGENESNGGGGIACRNVELLMREDVVIRGNVVRGWAGGGVFFSSSSEGGTLNLFHIIFWDIFRFDRSRLGIGDRVLIENNSTLDLPGQGHHAKGGGLYLLRADPGHDDIPHLEVAVAANVLRNNHAKLADGGDAGEGKTNFSLLDQIDPTDAGDTDYLAATSIYYYKSKSSK